MYYTNSMYWYFARRTCIAMCVYVIIKGVVVAVNVLQSSCTSEKQALRFGKRLFPPSPYIIHTRCNSLFRPSQLPHGLGEMATIAGQPTGIHKKARKERPKLSVTSLLYGNSRAWGYPQGISLVHYF